MAKPSNWRRLRPAEKYELADRVFRSLRGRMLIGQALACAAEALRDIEPEAASDMEMIGEMLYSPYYATHIKAFRALTQGRALVALSWPAEGC